MGAGFIFQDCQKRSIFFEGASNDQDGDYTIYTNTSIKDRLKGNSIKRAHVRLDKQSNNTYQIRINIDPAKLGYLFVGHATDSEGDHAVFSSYAGGDFAKNRTLWRLISVGDKKYQIQDVNYGAYLFAGHAVDDDGDHQLFAGTRMADDRRSHFEIFLGEQKISL